MYQNAASGLAPSKKSSGITTLKGKVFGPGYERLLVRQVFCGSLGLPALEVPVPFRDVLVQLFFGLEGATRDPVSKSWKSQALKVGVDFLVVAAVLPGYFRSDVV